MNACRFGLAPRFQLPADWSHRLSVGPEWHAPTEDERAALVCDAEGPAVLLFVLPRHLRRAWADLLEQAAGAEGALAGFAGFAGRVADFLAFKKLPVPAGAVLDVLVSAPGQAAVELAAGGQLWGAVNLGDDTAVVRFEALAEGAPAVRLVLGPGEGFRLADHAVRVTGWTLDRREPDMLLLIRSPGSLDLSFRAR